MKIFNFPFIHDCLLIVWLYLELSGIDRLYLEFENPYFESLDVEHFHSVV